MAVFVLQGDITNLQPFRVDALITLVNSKGLWFGGVDGAIKRHSGFYHDTLAQYMRTQRTFQSQSIFVNGSTQVHMGNFQHVVFVIDDLKMPLESLVFSALKECSERPFIKTVAMPVFRTGVAAGAYKGYTDEDTMLAMLRGIRLARMRNMQLPTIYIVVYNNPTQYEFLTQHLYEI